MTEKKTFTLYENPDKLDLSGRNIDEIPDKIKIAI